MVTAEDLENIKEIIKEQKQPILIEVRGGKIAIGLNDNAADYWNKKGFGFVTVNQLKALLLDENGEPRTEKEQKENIKVLSDMLTTFVGKVVYAEVG